MRWLLALIIVLALAWRFWPEPEPIPVEDTFIGEPVRALQDAQGFEDEYLEAQEARKQELERQLEEQTGGG